MKNKSVAPDEVLRDMSFGELEKQADILLAANPPKRDQLDEYDTVKRYTTPRLSQAPIEYKLPKHCKYRGEYLVCKMCGRPRSVGTASLCWACFRAKARKRLTERTMTLKRHLELVEHFSLISCGVEDRVNGTLVPVSFPDDPSFGASWVDLTDPHGMNAKPRAAARYKNLSKGHV